jgi:putative copper export protein
MTFWNIVLSIHLLCMAFFVGGQLILAGVLVPLLRGVNEGEPLRAAARRFGYGTVIAIAILVITGVAMATHDHRWSDSTLHLKLTLVVIVGVLIAVHMRKPTWHAVDAAIFLLSLGIVYCGVVIAG